jgi:chromate transporter
MALLFWAFFRVGLFGFGGGYAMIPLIQREIVELRGWLDITEFADLVAIAEMTPGPIAVNAATFIGYQQMGIVGAVSATAGVIMPALLIMLVLSYVFTRYSCVPMLHNGLLGVRPAVVALIITAALAMSRPMIASTKDVFVLAVVLFGLFKTKTHPIILLCLAGFSGLLIYSMP